MKTLGEFLSLSFGKNVPFGRCFLEISWTESKPSQQLQQEEKNRKTFVNARGKIVAKQDASAKKGMLSCFILSSLDS